MTEDLSKPISEESAGPGYPSAGWYPDPERPQMQRYWNGSMWTDERSPVPRSPRSAVGSRTIMVGILRALAALLLLFMLVEILGQG